MALRSGLRISRKTCGPRSVFQAGKQILSSARGFSSSGVFPLRPKDRLPRRRSQRGVPPAGGRGDLSWDRSGGSPAPLSSVQGSSAQRPPASLKAALQGAGLSQRSHFPVASSILSNKFTLQEKRKGWGEKKKRKRSSPWWFIVHTLAREPNLPTRLSSWTGTFSPECLGQA